MKQAVEPSDGEPLEAIPVGQRREGIAITAAAWLVLFLAVGAAAWYVWTQVVDSGGGTLVERYAKGDVGREFASLPDQFRVELPTAPRRHTQPSPYGTIAVVDSRPGSGYLFSVTSAPEPDTALESYGPTLDAAARALAQENGGEIVSAMKPTPIVDVAVKDVVQRKRDTYWRTRLLLTTNRLYTITAMMPGDDKAPFERLVRSFSALGPR